MANKRIEIRLRPEQEAAVEAWRNRQPGKPPRAFAIVMLMDIGLRAEGEKAEAERKRARQGPKK